MEILNNTSNNKRAVVYCRVSTKEQVEEGNSLATQEKICREYAIKNSYDVAEVFIEQGESAKTQDRTELQRLFAFCANKKNKISIVIAYKIDRISRNTDDYSQIRILLKHYGIEIKSTSEYFENSPAGRFMENIIANVAQFDNDVRTERSINGMKEAVRDGRYVWTAPVGYDNIRISGKSTIAPNEQLSPIIRKTFELIAQNFHPLEEIRMMMTREGLTNRIGRPLSKSYFYVMVRNELYTGKIIKFGESHKGTFEPIISETLFKEVQQVLTRRTRRNFHYMWENPDFPLRRFVYHLATEKKLTGGWSTGHAEKYPYYRFGVNGKSYPRDLFESTFVDYMNYYEFDNSEYGMLKKKLKENLMGVNADELKKSEQLEKHIGELKEKQNLIIQKNLDAIISDEILKQQLDRIENELLNTTALLAEVPKFQGSIDDLLKKVEAFLKAPGDTWAKVKFNKRLKLQWFQFPQGVFFDGERFGTAELCNVFKVKDIFLPSFSSGVPSGNRSWNEPGITSFQNEIDNTILWQKALNEMLVLSEVLNDTNN